MKKKIITAILIIVFSINFTNLLADPKLKIIENLKNTETLKFHFNQTSLNNKEEGICFLKRAYFLKCEYKDKNQKQLIIIKRTLVTGVSTLGPCLESHRVLPFIKMASE